MKLHHQTEVDEIRGRLKRTFSDTYLTLLSIIQGTTLALLFAKVDDLVGKGEFHAPELVATIALFLVIVLLWHQYQMGVMLFNWTPQLLDSFIPFFFGLCEFAAIVGLERGIWISLVSLGVFFTAAVVAFEYQYLMVRRANANDALIHRITAGFRIIDAIACALSAAILLGAAVAIAHLPGSAGALLGAWSILAVAVGHGAREVYSWHCAQRRLAETSFPR